MSDFSVRADHIDVEQIMRQIRARIRDKRGADYTEAEIRELASVKLDRFLDPRAVRSDLLGHFKRQHQPEPLFLQQEEWPALYTFEPDVIYGSTRDLPRRILRAIRKVLNPILKLFFNPAALTYPLALQPALNLKHRELFERISQRLQTRDELDALNFEMFNNLVVETTRLGIEVKNLRMQVESLSTRLDFDERRARALEGVVQYRPGTPLAPAAPAGGPVGAGGAEDEGEDAAADPGDGRGPRRRRRRRGRRRGGAGPEAAAGQPGSEAAGGEDEGSDETDTDAAAPPETSAMGDAAPAEPSAAPVQAAAVEATAVAEPPQAPEPGPAPGPDPEPSGDAPTLLLPAVRPLPAPDGPSES